jgi:hypothetical protein
MTTMTLDKNETFRRVRRCAVPYLYRVFRSADAEVRLLFVVHLQSE